MSLRPLIVTAIVLVAVPVALSRFASAMLADARRRRAQRVRLEAWVRSLGGRPPAPDAAVPAAEWMAAPRADAPPPGPSAATRLGGAARTHRGAERDAG